MQKLTAIHSTHQIPAEDWQRLYQLSGDGYPFLDRRFLQALEDSDCIGRDAGHASGWQICYLTEQDNGRITTLLPCFIKQHSYGEYVFDWSWAEAYERYGLSYYPKLLWGIPFTPATGPRILSEKHTVATCLSAVTDLCRQQQLSGWHLNFLRVDELPQNRLQAAQRSGCQYHWFNQNYRDFDHYLAHFVSRKRKSVRKERQKIAQQALSLTRKSAADISAEDIQFFYQCYLNTYRERRSYPYLNEDFFQQLRATMAEKMLLVIAHNQHRQPVACALYFFDQHTLYGRYWGCLQEFDALHFEACYYQGIEFCLERGLQRFDPGTQGEHKISRGFTPVITHSLHHLQHPGMMDAVQHFAQEEQQHILDWQQQATTLLPFRTEE